MNRKTKQKLSNELREGKESFDTTLSRLLDGMESCNQEFDGRINVSVSDETYAKILDCKSDNETIVQFLDRIVDNIAENNTE